MSANFAPTGQRLLIKPCDPESITPGGIVLPDNAQKRATRGTVVAVGLVETDDGDTFELCLFSDGDDVLFQPYAGSEVELDGEVHLVVDVKDVLGRFEKEE